MRIKSLRKLLVAIITLAMLATCFSTLFNCESQAANLNNWWTYNARYSSFIGCDRNSDGYIYDGPRYLFVDRDKSENHLNDLYCIQSGNAQDSTYTKVNLYDLENQTINLNGTQITGETLKNMLFASQEDYEHFMWILENMYVNPVDSNKKLQNLTEYNRTIGAEQLPYNPLETITSQYIDGGAYGDSSITVTKNEMLIKTVQNEILSNFVKQNPNTKADLATFYSTDNSKIVIDDNAKQYINKIVEKLANKENSKYYDINKSMSKNYEVSNGNLTLEVQEDTANYVDNTSNIFTIFNPDGAKVNNENGIEVSINDVISAEYEFIDAETDEPINLKEKIENDAVTAPYNFKIRYVGNYDNTVEVTLKINVVYENITKAELLVPSYTNAGIQNQFIINVERKSIEKSYSNKAKAEQPIFDLALTKQIVSVSGSKENSYNRLNTIDTSLLEAENASRHDARYFMDKTPIKVERGDIVKYRITVYNEGQIDGYAEEIKDYLPAGLEMVDPSESEINQLYNWQKFEGRNDIIVSNYLRKERNERENKISAYQGGTFTANNYKYVELECKVSEDAQISLKVLDNRAEISKYGYYANQEINEPGNTTLIFYEANKTMKSDIDSFEDNVLSEDGAETTSVIELINQIAAKVNAALATFSEQENDLDKYNAGYEDDDDLERLVVVEDKSVFDLALRKWIYKVEYDAGEVEYNRQPVPYAAFNFEDDTRYGEIGYKYSDGTAVCPPALSGENRASAVLSYYALLLEGGDTSLAYNSRKVEAKDKTTLPYDHDKTHVEVEPGDIITYRIAIFNEGTKAGFANEVKDYLPKGIELVEPTYDGNNQPTNTNARNGWKVKSTLDDGTTVISTRKLDLSDEDNLISTISESYTDKYVSNSANPKKAVKLLEVECRVTENVDLDKNLTNRAEITEYGYINGNGEITVENYVQANEKGKDVDSIQNTINNNLNLDGWYESKVDETNPSDTYIRGEEDDDDFETVYVKSVEGEYGLEILKTDEEGTPLCEPTAVFLVNDVPSPTYSKTGIAYITKGAKITKENYNTPSTFNIAESEAPAGYIGLKDELYVTVNKKLDVNQLDVENFVIQIKRDGSLVGEPVTIVPGDSEKTLPEVKLTDDTTTDIKVRILTSAASGTINQLQIEVPNKPVEGKYFMNIMKIEESTAGTTEETKPIQGIDFIVNYYKNCTSVTSETAPTYIFSKMTNSNGEFAIGTDVDSTTGARIFEITNVNVDEIDTFEISEAPVANSSAYFKLADKIYIKVKKEQKDGKYVVKGITLSKGNAGTDENYETEKTINGVGLVGTSETVTVTASVVDNTINVTIPNAPKVGEYSLKIVKHNTSGNIVESNETRFKIYGEASVATDETTGEATLKSNVKINVDNVNKPDEYIIKEETVPTGYVGLRDLIAVKVYKEIAEGELKVQKADITTNCVISETDGTIIDGNISTVNADNTEVSIPNVYLKDGTTATIKVQIDETSNIVIKVQNKEKIIPYQIQLQKTSTNRPEPLAGVQFKLNNETTLETNIDGKIYLDSRVINKDTNLPILYTITEVEDANSKYFQISGDIKLYVNKEYDRVKSKDVIRISLQDDENRVYRNKDRKRFNLVGTDEKVDIIASVDDSNNMITINIPNKPKTGEYSLQVLKTDLSGNAVTRSKAGFTILQNDETQGTEIFTGLTDGIAKLVTDKTINVDNVIGTDTYTITETTVPQGYYGLQKAISLEVTKKVTTSGLELNTVKMTVDGVGNVTATNVSGVGSNEVTLENVPLTNGTTTTLKLQIDANNQIQFKVQNESKTNMYSLELLKQSTGNVSVNRVPFIFGAEHEPRLTDSEGRLQLGEYEITSENVNTIDTYTLTEAVSDGNILFALRDPIVLKVKKELVNTSYVVSGITLDGTENNFEGIKTKTAALKNTDQTVEVKAQIYNNTIEIRVPNIPKEGYYSLEILKQDSNGEVLKTPTTGFKLGDSTTPIYTNESTGIATIIPHKDIEPANLTTPDTYVITESNPPTSYAGIAKPVNVTVNKSLTATELVITSVTISVEGVGEVTAQKGGEEVILENVPLENETMSSLKLKVDASNKITLTVLNSEVTDSYRMELLKINTETNNPVQRIKFNVTKGTGTTREFVTDAQGKAYFGLYEIRKDNLGVDEFTIEEQDDPDMRYYKLAENIKLYVKKEYDSSNSKYNIRINLNGGNIYSTKDYVNVKLQGIDETVKVEAEVVPDTDYPDRSKIEIKVPNKMKDVPDSKIHKGVKTVENQDSGYYYKNLVDGKEYTQEELAQVVHKWVIETTIEEGIENYTKYFVTDPVDSEKLVFSGLDSVKVSLVDTNGNQSPNYLVPNTDYIASYENNILKVMYIGTVENGETSTPFKGQFITNATVGSLTGYKLRIEFNTTFKVVNGELVVLQSAEKCAKNKSTLTYNNGIESEDVEKESEEPEVHTGAVSVFKYDDANENKQHDPGERALVGAEFKIAESQANAVAGIFIKDGNGQDLVAVSNEDGVATFVGLEYGGDAINSATQLEDGTYRYDINQLDVEGKSVISKDYYIVETKAPTGYNLLTETIPVTVSKTSTQNINLTDKIKGIGNQNIKGNYNFTITKKDAKTSQVIEDEETTFDIFVYSKSNADGTFNANDLVRIQDTNGNVINTRNITAQTNGITAINNISITSECVTAGTYYFVIVETKAPDKYTEINYKVVVPVTFEKNGNVYVAKHNSANSYALVKDSTGSEVRKSLTEMSTKATECVSTEITDLTINVNVPNKQKEFDLSLRKFISSVNNAELTGKDKREPVVDLSTLINGDPEKNGEKTATYIHTKNALLVNPLDLVEYTIRIYNEGEIAGYANRVIDDVPSGVTMVAPKYDDNGKPINQNAKYRWKMYKEMTEADKEANTTANKSVIMYADKKYIETENENEAVIISTDYLSMENGIRLKAENTELSATSENPNLIPAFDGTTLSHRDIKVQFKVKTDNKPEDIITNYAQISEHLYKDGTTPDKDRDSTPNVWKDKEDDQDIENIKVTWFDLALYKWVSSTIVTEDGKTKEYPSGHTESDKDKVVNVTIAKDKLKSTVVKFKWTIKVKNEGRIAGYAKELKDHIPEGLKFVEEDNKEFGWKLQEDGTITTDYLKDTLLQREDTAEVTLILTWVNNENNLGVKVNNAEISKDYNVYGTPDIDSTPNNFTGTPVEDDEDKDEVRLNVRTGNGFETIHAVIAGIALVIVAGGVFGIKKYVLAGK